MAEQVPPEPESPYATEGTAAHALGELKARLAFDMITKRKFNAELKRWREEFAITPEVEAEMNIHTDAYVELIRERMALYPYTQVYLEQRLDTGVPNSWGTSDTVLVSPFHVEIIDLKYGAGVPVEAKGNPQLRFYGLGALDAFGDLLGETQLVRITVFQPRLNHTLTDEMTPEALRAWRTEVAIPAAELALSDDAPFGPSETACRWCPASGRCRAQIEAVFAEEPFEREPDVLTPEELADALNKRKHVQDWLNALEKVALDTAYSQGVPLPGYKVVLSGGVRRITDVEDAETKLLAAGYDQDDFLAPKKIKGIGELEKLLGKDTFKELLEDTGVVKKTDGKPALAPESDKRPAISPHGEAAREFGDAEDVE